MTMSKKTKRIVYGLGFTDEDLDKPANAFSGGQKTRINLAKGLGSSSRFSVFRRTDKPFRYGYARVA